MTKGTMEGKREEGRMKRTRENGRMEGWTREKKIGNGKRKDRWKETRRAQRADKQGEKK